MQARAPKYKSGAVNTDIFWLGGSRQRPKKSQKSTPGRPGCSPELPRSSPGVPKAPQSSPELPRSIQELQRLPKAPPGSPELPRGSLELPQSSQESPGSSPKAPRTPQRSPKPEITRNGVSKTRYYAGENSEIQKRSGKYRHILALWLETASQKEPKEHPGTTRMVFLCRRERHSGKSER